MALITCIIIHVTKFMTHKSCTGNSVVCKLGVLDVSNKPFTCVVLNLANAGYTSTRDQ
jgi:hypothetical protein